MSCANTILFGAVRKRHADMAWHLYLIECANGSIYTGIAVDVQARYAKHVDGTGARYTRAHKPVRLLATFTMADRSTACRTEYRVKRLPAHEKRALAQGLRALPDTSPDSCACPKAAT
ncbi:putative endonuclease [Mycetohabitans endofungorum]|uniref:Putative endonuclease n=2 Tax=Burkholderiaceae TaxID=119060 RepID=A0A2P5KE81_9BURK|nr:putative endonuclease [Mycetohabitans endofungorum]